ncbi:MAG TPA: capsule assembly Wzi family protein [Pedobacter sp.]|jgi:hypothetical protein
MNRKKVQFLTLCLYAIFSAFILDATAQNLSLQNQVLDDYYRREQLFNKIDSSVSFTIRPLSASALGRENMFYPDSSGIDSLQHARLSFGPVKMKLLPVIVKTQFTSHHPSGWNDGAMIPNAGLQTLVSAGVHAHSGLFSLQFQPELVVAENSRFPGFPGEYQIETWAVTYDYYYNLIDAPERYGKGTYTRFNWGQSSARVNYKQFSAGLSTENLWWGPGRRNSLLMSNNAPGFKHLTLNTSSPIHTYIGSFEAQLIAGRLENSGFAPPGADSLLYGTPIYKPKSDLLRDISGFIVSYQPKWVNGLFLGYARTAQNYSNKAIARPFLLPFKRFNYDKARDEDRGYDQYLSLFARWIFPEAHGELYFEYGLNSHPFELDRQKGSPGHSRAYTFGLRKFIPTQRPNTQYLIDLEISQLSGPADYIGKGGESWYVHDRVRHGYTHKGEILGAGIGTGGNLQSLSVSRIQGLNRLGLQLERHVRNNDLLFYAIKDYRRHWVDLSLALNADRTYKKFIFNGGLHAIKSLNYQYYLENVPGVFFVKGRDIVNIQANLGLAYRF